MRGGPVLARTWVAAASLALLGLAGGAQAQIFGGDDQARQAILDLRQRFDQAVTAQNRLVEENTNLRRSMLELQQQQETLRAELAQAHGQQEELAREVSELRNRVEALQTLDDRLQRLESGGAPTDGEAAAASGDEQRDYEAALSVFRTGDYAAAQSRFASFVKRYPSSSLAPAALFWLGNAQYATRNYKEAITNFRSLLAAAPNHSRAPEALLSIANCQIELKETSAARATLESLAKTYPQSEAAQAGRERLASLK